MQIYNSLSNKKEEFVPQEDNFAKIYVCGPTVYNYFHIGNARPFVVFDTLRRYLEYRGMKVNFVQNFTDIDDKIINKAKEEGVTAAKVAEQFIAAYFTDAEQLNLRPATVHPRVTEHIPELIDFIQILIDKGFAYEAGGDVYFRSGKAAGYGKLSGQNIDELRSGARIEVNEAKADPLDFVLWKAQKEDTEVSWDSPWGKGRPGWHTECSVMSKKYLGNTIDIHGGGADLKFPHHENEIAQSEAANEAPFASYFMHNGYITIDNKKMSKSLGNFTTVHDLLKSYDGLVLRLFLLQAHYRSPINFSAELLDSAKAALGRIRGAARTWGFAAKATKATKAEPPWLGEYRRKFIAAMDDDLNTAGALAAVFDLIGDVNSKIAAEAISPQELAGGLALLKELTGVLGLRREDASSALPDEIQALVDRRAGARADKDFATADAIRDELNSKGYTVKDTKDGQQVFLK